MSASSLPLWWGLEHITASVLETACGGKASTFWQWHREYVVSSPYLPSAVDLQASGPTVQRMESALCLFVIYQYMIEKNIRSFTNPE